MPKITKSFRLDDQVANLLQIISQTRDNVSISEVLNELILTGLKNEELYNQVKDFLSEKEFNKYEKYLK